MSAGVERLRAWCADPRVFVREAFGVKPGDPMYLPPEKRARIW